jgi:hypothetical protein
MTPAMEGRFARWRSERTTSYARIHLQRAG